MRQATLTVVLILATFVSAQEASIQRGYLRGSVAKLQEPDRHVLLEFLDRGRTVSEAVLATIVSGQRDETTKDLRDDVREQWTATAEAFASARAETPSIRVEYRNQAIEFRTSAAAKEVITTRTWFACVSPSSPQGEFFISVVLDEEDDGHQIVLAIESAKYVNGAPEFLLQTEASSDVRDKSDS
jgi:hypothetical protein